MSWVDVRTPAPERLAAKLSLVASGCVIWTGVTTKVGGHGRLMVGGVNTLAHRYAWELARGPIPEGLHVLHRCDNPPCCNVEHLFLGTNAENVADKMAKGRFRNGRGTGMCLRGGHELTPSNTYVYPSGKRICRACKNARQRSRRAARP